MKFLVPLALLTVITVGSAFPLWLPVSQPIHSAAASSLPTGSAALRPLGPGPSQLLGFESSPIAPAAPSLLTDIYFYEGQYVRRGQVLAKLKTRPTNAIAYLNAPHDGVLSRARAQVGQVLPPATALATLTDQTRLHLRPGAHHFRAGDSIRVSLAGSAAAPVRGKVTSASGTELTVQLRRSVAGAVVGSSLTLAAHVAFVRVPTAAAPGGPAHRRLRFSPAVARR